MVSETAAGMPAYTVRRSARARRARLTITDAGAAVVVLPVRSSEREAGELVAHHRGWLERHVLRIRQRQARLAGRLPLDQGRSLLLDGVARQVVVLTALDPRTRSSVVVSDAGAIVIERGRSERRPTAQLLEGWLRAEARDVIGHRVAQRAAEMSVEVTRVTIRDQRTRWGSASRTGTLSFNWRLVMCPPAVLDYVVVHELSHLRVAGHGRTFWRLVDQFVLDSRAARRWLREHHHELRHALD